MERTTNASMALTDTSGNDTITHSDLSIIPLLDLSCEGGVSGY